MKIKLLLFITIIGTCTFNINSHDNKVKVKDFNLADKDRVQSMLEDHFKQFGLESKEEVSSLLSFTMDDFLKYRNSVKKVLMKDNKTIGYINYKQSNQNPSFWVISEVAVDKQYQNKGYGKQLMQTSLEDISKRDGRKVFLVVLKDNKQARNLYENKLGFKTNSGLISEDHEDLVVLSLELSELDSNEFSAP